MDVPDPLPLRNIEVPREVTAVDGCTCGGATWHRVPQFWDDPASGCALFSLPPEQARAAVEAAEDREAAWGAALNARLRESLDSLGWMP